MDPACGIGHGQGEDPVLGRELREERVSRSSARESLHALQDSLGNPERLAIAYDRAKRDTVTLRLVLGLLDRIYPAQAFLHLAHEFDQAIRNTDYASACQEALPKLVGTWHSAAPSKVAPLLHAGGAVFYGNHPSLATPFLLGAAVPRPDLHFVSTGYVCKLIPAFGDRSYPVEMPLDRITIELRRGGTKRVLAHGLMSLLHAVPNRETLKTLNRRSLSQAAEHVRGGGALVICPDGGGRKPGHWYKGIAQIAQALAQSGEEVQYVPFHESDCTNQRIYPRLMRGPVASLRTRWSQRRPARLRFGEPISSAALAAGSQSSDAILATLRHQYEEIAR